MAFKHHISFAIDLASRFGCGRFRIMPDIVSKRLCAAICSIRIWADALLSDKSSIEICCFCTGFGSEFTELFLCHIFTLRPINDRKIERSDARCFGRQQPLACALHRKFHLSLKKSDLSRPNIYKALKYFWLSNWVSIARVVAVQ